MELTLDQLKAMLAGMVPFAGKLGLELEEAREGLARMALPFDASNGNHVGSVHAGAIFSLMETAGGIASFVTFGEMATRLVVAGGRIDYRRRVSGRTTAVAEVPADLVARALEDVRTAGKAFFAVAVRATDDAGEVVAEASFDYRLKPPA